MPVLDHISREDNKLIEPNSGVEYWVVFPNDYSESFTTNSGNTTTFRYRVAWEDVAEWKRGMLGYTEGTAGGNPWRRTKPHRNPYAPLQYCVDLTLVNQTANTDQVADPSTMWAKDEAYNNYPLGGWCEYQATYTNLPYLVDVPNSYIFPYTRKTRRSVPIARKTPSMGFETVATPPVPITEVGFIPWVETEFVYTLYQIPMDLVPENEIAALGGHVNINTFDSKQPERVLFKGLANPIEPYPGPSGELYTNLTYLMVLHPFSGGWNYFPLNVNQSTLAINWVRVRARTNPASTGNGIPLYPSGDFTKLFLTRA